MVACVLSNVIVHFSDAISCTETRVYGMWGLCTACSRSG